MNTGLKNAINFSAFYLCWFMTAYGVVIGLPWLGPLMIALYLVMHARYIVPSSREIIFILVGGVLGYGADNLFLHTGVVEYPVALTVYLAPVWMLFVWFSFLSLFHVSLGWLSSRPLLGAVLGGLGGPLSYRWAHSMGVFTLGDPQFQSLMILALAWGLITPFLLWFSNRPYFQLLSHVPDEEDE